MEENYELNERDIEATIKYLKIFDPENATPEMAISLLEEMRTGVRTLANTKPEVLEQLQKELKKKN